MNGWAAKIISQEVADKVGKCWGMGSEYSGLENPGPWEGELEICGNQRNNRRYGSMAVTYISLDIILNICRCSLKPEWRV